VVDPIRFVSSNPNKLAEANRLLGIDLEPVSLDLVEVQAASAETITLEKLTLARTKIDGRLIVEDVSLGFVSLGGFPGPYIRWLMESAGGEGLGRIARGLDDRRATAICCVAFWDGKAAHLFHGSTDGHVNADPRGLRTFGWDPWFQPDGSNRSFGEMTSEEKDEMSHRARAYRKLAAHLIEHEGRARREADHVDML